MSNANIPTVKIPVVLELLATGYTRYENKASEPGKSLEAYYNLRPSQLAMLCDHPQVKGVKTKYPLLIIEDENGVANTVYAERSRNGKEENEEEPNLDVTNQTTETKEEVEVTEDQIMFDPTSPAF